VVEAHKTAREKVWEKDCRENGRKEGDPGQFLRKSSNPVLKGIRQGR